jgi:hypothetical protein
MRYRKKPVVIEAYQTDKELDIETLEGTMHASVGDYIITGVRGEQYPCKPDIFEQTYEPADVPTASPWHRVEEELPESNDAVNVVWANRNPESYYAGIKDKPFVATAHYHKGKWYWFSATCKDFLDEYGRCEVDEVDKDIDILYWMPLPSPPVNKMFTK